MSGDDPDIELSRRRVIQSSFALTGGIATSGAAEGTPEEGNRYNNIEVNTEEVGTSRFVEIGMIFNGLPDRPTINHHPFEEYSIKPNEELVLRRGGLAPTGLENGENRRERFKGLVRRNDPIVRTPMGFHANREIEYREERKVLVKGLNDRMHPVRATPIGKSVTEPGAEIEIRDAKTIVRREDKASEIEINSEREVEFPSITVPVKQLSEGTIEVEDPRLEEVANEEDTKRTVSKREIVEYDVKPQIAIKDHGRLNVLSEDLRKPQPSA